MLVLSRSRQESIIVTTSTGERIEIVTMEIRGDKVRLGIEAPKSVTVHRKEVQELIERQEAKR